MNGASMSDYSVQFLSHLFRKFIFEVYIGSSQEKGRKEKYEMAAIVKMDSLFITWRGLKGKGLREGRSHKTWEKVSEDWLITSQTYALASSEHMK